MVAIHRHLLTLGLLVSVVIWPVLLSAATVTVNDSIVITASVVDDTGNVGNNVGGKIFIPPLIEIFPNIPPIIIDPLPRLCKIADLNCDGYVDLIDFSILIYWFDRENAPEHVDIANDDIINIRDFSVMAFHWTG